MSSPLSCCNRWRCGACALVLTVLCAAIAIGVSPLVTVATNGVLDSRYLLDSTNRSCFKEWQDSTPTADGNGTRYLKLYVFNVTNAAEVVEGAKPQLKEVGPYTYSYGWKRFNLSWSGDRDVIRYQQWQYYVFNRNLSVGPESDTFTTANIPFWGIVHKHTPLFGNKPLNLAPALYACNLGVGGQALKTCEQPCGSAFCPSSDCDGAKLCPTNVSVVDRAFMTKSIKEVAFGYLDPQLAVAHGFDPVEAPARYPGFFPNVTSFEDAKRSAPPQAVHTGLVDKASAYYHTITDGFEYIKACPPADPPNASFNPDSKACVSPWSTKHNNSANKVGGSDGMLYPRDIDQQSTLTLWVDPALRQIPLINEGGKTIDFKGIELLKFVPDPTSYASAYKVKANAAYYQFQGGGFFNLTSAQYGAPIFLSFPHFLHAENASHYVRALEGLSPPDEAIHGYDFGVQPTLGKVMYGSGKQQVNIKIGPVNLGAQDPNTTWFPKMRKDIMLPTIWIADGGNATDAQVAEFKASLGIVGPVTLGTQITFGVFSGLFAVLTFYACVGVDFNRREGGGADTDGPLLGGDYFDKNQQN